MASARADAIIANANVRALTKKLNNLNKQPDELDNRVSNIDDQIAANASKKTPLEADKASKENALKGLLIAQLNTGANAAAIRANNRIVMLQDEIAMLEAQISAADVENTRLNNRRARMLAKKTKAQTDAAVVQDELDAALTDIM